MLSIPLRKQGGAAIVTIPAAVLKSLHLKIGQELELDVRDGALVLTPAQPAKRQRYSLDQLLVGATPTAVRALNDATAWAREGEAVGREIA